MTNEESNIIHLIAFISLGFTLGGIVILLNHNIRNADIGNEKFAFGMILAGIFPSLLSMSLIIKEYRQKR